jgi:hypothetical protein
MRRLLLLSLLGLLVSAAPASAAFTYKAFRTPTGNIRCAGTGDLKTGKSMNLRCDVGRHTWTAPKRPKSCGEGDYGSTLELTRRGHARFGCVSDAIDPTKLLKYGVLWKFGPFSCRVRTTGLRCRNAAGHGWFVSRTSYKRF